MMYSRTALFIIKPSIMRSIIYLLLASLLFMSAKNPTSQGIEFFQGSFTSAKLKASQEGRLFFLDFTASWCTPCRWMEETTFTDPTLAAYVKENYVALQVDIDDFDGFALKQEYNIQILPSLLIFNSRGELLGQYEESLSPSSMLEILKQYDQPQNRIASRPVLKKHNSNANVTVYQQPQSHQQINTYQDQVPQTYNAPSHATNQAATSSTLELPATFIVNQPDAVESTPVDYTSNRPQAVGQISRNRLIRKEEIEETNYETFGGVVEMPTQNVTEEEIKPTLHTLPATLTPSNTPVGNNYAAATTNETIEKPFSHLPLVDPYNDNGQGLYRLQVARQRSQGYSIQVGAYSEYGNVLKQASLMQQHFSEPVIVHISTNRNRELYKLMLGEFDTRTAAINFMRTVQAKGVDCMVKDLSNN